MRGAGVVACAAMAAFLLTGAACRRRAEAPPSVAAGSRADARVDSSPRPDGRRREVAATPAADAGATDDDDTAAAVRLNDLICKRPRCCVTRAMPAGTGGDGTRYTVVRVDLHPSRRRCPAPQTGNQQDTVDPVAIKANEAGELDETQCERYRWDLIAESGEKVRWRQPLAIDQWCSSSYGMGGGDNGLSADAAARTITFSREDGSNWRGDETVTLGVDPLRIARISHRSWWTMGTDERRLEWSWDAFSGEESTSTAFCRDAGQSDAGFPPQAAGAHTDDRDEPVADRDEVIVPEVVLPAAFVKDGWATLPFRSCAAHVDGKDDGFTIHGPARGDSADSEMWVVMSSGGVLFVEASDDRWVAAAKSWVKADHLELWRAIGEPAHPSGCFQPDPNARALQWAVGLDGQVYNAHGSPSAAPTVRVARGEHSARFRIVLPDEGKGLTVVYSDSDDGVRQKRLIATSRFQFGRPWTVGGATPVGPGRATCVVDGASLRPKVTPLRRAPGLLLDDLPPELDGKP
jgi:hypothetical protein